MILNFRHPPFIRDDAIQLLVQLNDGRMVGDLVGLLHPDGEPDEDIGSVSDGEPRVRSPDTMVIHALARLTGRPADFDPTAPRPARARRRPPLAPLVEWRSHPRCGKG